MLEDTRESPKVLCVESKNRRPRFERSVFQHLTMCTAASVNKEIGVTWQFSADSPLVYTEADLERLRAESEATKCRHEDWAEARIEQMNKTKRGKKRTLDDLE